MIFTTGNAPGKEIVQHGTAPIRVIGIGNTHRRDDGVGIEIARHIREKVGRLIDVVEASGEVAGLIDAWTGADTVIAFDAVLSGGEPGEIYRVDAVANAVPIKFGLYSSHSMGLAEAVELSRALGTLPRRLVIYGIEGSDFGMGVGLTDEVEKSAHKLVHSTLVAVQSAAQMSHHGEQDARN